MCQHANFMREYVCAVSDEGDTYFLVEHAKFGCLQGYLENSWKEKIDGKISVILDMVVQLISPLTQMQNSNVLHMDLTPKNIFVLDVIGADTKRGEFSFPILAISNFGNPRHWTKSKWNKNLSMEKFWAPEIKAGKKCTIESEVYSIGVVCYMILCGEFPWTPSGEWVDRRHDVREFSAFHPRLIDTVRAA